MAETPSLTIESVVWDDPRAVALRTAMDEEMGARYASAWDDWDQAAAEEARKALTLNPADIRATYLAVVDGEAVGHAALRRLGQEWELKRVVTLRSHRGHGISKSLIEAVEAAAVAEDATRLILQTGDRQPEAVRLYEWLGYTPIPVYAPYDALPMSLCFARELTR
ncbi:GNAT family N-acetyltransferase [Leifsonia flava]|uniref:GNAT family N-acetyltransferase n=1 Tax=Orlajensenia leifsoniae TaxID=2561933 RepID=A0A4Y9R3B9_9MICO|nr:GNAT family N-acetyltransferase [Leifsonia flava]TFV98056.1 GNAT family N-acetyltransferase [Leifsonia flava]